jgi:hypothetical protein
MRASLIVTLSIAVIASGCGLRFGPGYSMNDGHYFAETPRIVVKGDSHVLRWRYGDAGFFFLPSSKVLDDKLLFALQGTSSSGSLAGQYGELAIDDTKQVRALETGGAFWVEPDGRKVPLEVVKE